MAKIINTGSEVDVSLYLTERAKDYIINGNIDSVTFDKVAIGDSDINYENIINLPDNGDILDILGTSNDVIGSIRQDTDIKSKLFLNETGSDVLGDTILSGQSSSGFQKYTRLTSTLNISGSSFSYTKIERNNNLNNNNHYLKSLNLPITTVEKQEFDSNYSNKGIQLLNQNTAIMINIDKNAYLENIDGRNIRFTVPFATGGTFDFITKFFDVSNSGADNQLLRSDPNTFSEQFGIELGDDNETNIAYVFSDDIIPPISGGSWEDYTEAKYSDTRENVGSLTGGTFVDKCVGIAYLDKGIILITHPDFVDNFDFSNALNASDDTLHDGSEDFEDIYIPNQTMSFRTIERIYAQNFNYIISETSFNRTSNSTFDDTINSNLYITEIGLYNSSNELIAYGKFSEPILKQPNVTAIPITLRICI